MQIGAQLYTVYNHIRTLEGFADALKKIADIGYKAVQVSGACPYDPQWLKQELDKNSLRCVLTHVVPDVLVNDTKRVVSEHQVFGCSHIGIGGMPATMRGSLEGYLEFKKIYLPVAEKMRDLGAKLMYHNHWFEFDKLDGKDVIERILEDFPEDSIDFTLDLGWASFAGMNVVELIRTLKGRIPIVHLKDYADMPEDGSIDTPAYLRPIYEGKLDYDSYIKELEKAGCKYMLVEQDYTYGECAFGCLKRSYENVVSRFPETK